MKSKNTFKFILKELHFQNKDLLELLESMKKIELRMEILENTIKSSKD